MRWRSSWRTSRSSARTLSSSRAVDGMTLFTVPAWNMPTVTTAEASGSMLRATIDCSAITMLAPATIGSQLKCGIAACPPLPRTVMTTRSAEASAGPLRKPSVPSGWPGALCSAKMASQGKRWNRPSSTMRLAPPAPSSAGWKIRFSVPLKRRVSARWRAAASKRGGVAVVAAGVHLAVVAAGVGQPGGLDDGQRVHVGADADALAAVAVAQPADDAGAAQAAVHLVAPGGQALGHQVAGGMLLEGQFGVLVDVVAQAHHLGQDGGDLLAQGVHVHATSPKGAAGRACGQATLARRHARQPAKAKCAPSFALVHPMTADPAPVAAPAPGAEDCAEQLRQHFPALFVGAPKPLKLRIQADIQARAPGVFAKAALSAFLRRHTGRTGYLIALTRATQRFDLDGAPAGEISAEHRQAALDELARRRALQADREAAEQEQRRQRAELLRAYEGTSLSLANFCALKGVAVDELPALLEQARREAAERAQAPPQRRDRPGPRRRNG